ncbi:hypothetical protein GCM10028798_35890 [Humibacter antri]
MSSIAAPDESDHHSAGLIVAAVLSWIAPLAVLVSRLTSPALPVRVPSHWSTSGTVDGWSSIDGVFWTTLPAGIVGALLVTLIVVFGGNNIPRIKGSLGLAGIALVSSGISLVWFVTIAVARRPDASGTAFGMLVLGTVILAALVFGAGSLPRRSADGRARTEPEQPADGGGDRSPSEA